MNDLPVCRRCGCAIQPGTAQRKLKAVTISREPDADDFCGYPNWTMIDDGADDIHRNADECMVALKRRQVEAPLTPATT